MKEVVSKAAWTGESLQESPLWGYALDGAEVAQLVDALRSFKNAGHDYRVIEAGEMQRSMFPLTGLSDLLESIREELETGTGAVMLKNLPVDQFDDNDLAVIHSGISKHVGHIIQQAGGRVRSESRGHGKYIGRVVAEMSGTVPLNGKQANNRFLLHTDVCDAISLLCVKNDNGSVENGGSIVASALAIYNAMVAETPELVAELFKPVPRLWTVSKNLHCDIPVWKFYGEEMFSTQLTPVYTEVSQLLPHAPMISEKQVAAMNALQDIGSRIGLKFSLEPGDCYFLNNHLAYHGRTGWDYTPTAPASRKLLRTWISPYNSRALPDEANYVELWGSTRAGIPRGRAHMSADDPETLRVLDDCNKRIEELIHEGKYDYYDLYRDYDRFMSNIGRTVAVKADKA
ncbi:TauD/TfdA family dioxygenase [Streptomyces hayashii]|uniref:TauD/TfdA family dioxygenase n=1 Tax=Streptomyces hayashii TaxID=2839966 RepID=UPI00403CCAD7